MLHLNKQNGKVNLKKKKLCFGLLIVCIIIVGWILWENTALEINTYSVSDKKIPTSFHGYRIAQISDLHNAEFGDNNETLINLLKKATPDIIVITGDLVDSRNTNIEIGIAFAKQAVSIAPTYYITGNHEARIEEYDTLKTKLEELGVMILNNEAVTLEKSAEHITLLGIDDPSFQTDYLFGDAETVVKNTLEELEWKKDTYTILLSHRPELFELYAEKEMDLVFSGHAHGGQFRLPFIGGVVAPNQGFFPKYDAGLYKKEHTTMVVSRGIGNSIIPIRFHNRPEIVVVELMTSIK